MLISFEGIDGSGKSTQAKRLMARLAVGTKELLYVREPGGTDVSERIRELLLDPAVQMEGFTEMLLFSAARAQLVREKMRPVYDRGGVIICDRFYDSTIAYQGGGRGVADPEWLHGFQEQVVGGLVPDRTYLIRLTVDQAAARLTKRFGEDQAADRLESAGEEFFLRVFDAYEHLTNTEPGRFCVIDGSGTEDEVEAAIWEDLSGHLQN